MKKLLISILLCGVAFGADVLSGVKALVGDEIYAKNYDLIGRMFANKKSFTDENGRLNYARIVPNLTARSWLVFNFRDAWDTKVKLTTNASGMKFLVVVDDALRELGFSEILPLDYDGVYDKISLTLQIKSEFMLNPSNFYTELKRRGVFIDSVKRIDNTSYEYELDFTKAQIPTDNYVAGSTLSIAKSMKSYMFDVKGRSSVKAVAYEGGRWVPLIRFFDEELNLISQHKSKANTNYFAGAIPKGTRYMSIDDAFTTENIRRGFEILIR